ncbi:hypothetical protein AVEN_162699-1 [Araneus ventricosus]|uniref:Uncharacterized protein n=1 Tax=Araneus ventricosus TaxID=182803 RepID=A0A4Y2Q244_ARAVE|nr:hypothetical protein AVEN_162699-1 [Araneus ventricosus]
MADDKAEAFARCLLGDVFGCFSLAAKLNINIPPELEEDRCVPDYFFTEMLDFIKPFINGLTSDIECLPGLLYASDDFFKRFTYSVCLKLSNGGDDERISFLKVTAFLVAIAASSFLDGCYRSIDDIPGIYHKMLRDHLSTKFYVEDKFEEMIWKGRELQDDEKWKSKTLDEMRMFIEESCNVELAATEITPNSFEHHTCELSILDLRKQQLERWESDIVRCKYCGINCVLFLKVFFQPRIKYKPECQQM